MGLNDFIQIFKIDGMCRKCGKKIELSQIYRTTVCPDCGADLHSCVNCRFYSPSSHYECKETVDELVKDKERANFCDFFSVNKDDFAAGSSSSASSKTAAARSAFNSLFGN